MFPDVWSENAALLERLMEIHLNPPVLSYGFNIHINYQIQWNLVITRSDITKSSYNEVILLVPALYISLFFYPDIMRNLK